MPQAIAKPNLSTRDIPGVAASLALWTRRFVANDAAAWPRAERWINSNLEKGPGGVIREVPRTTLEALRRDPSIFKPKEPLVIVSALEGSAAVERWSLDYFSDAFGDEPVHFSGWLKDTADKVPVMANKVPLRDAIAGLRDNADNAVRSYADLGRKYPDLLDDLDGARLDACFDVDVSHTDLWMANKGNISPFHCAGGANLFCMVHGSKRWTLVSPRETPLMYPEVGRNHARPVLGLAHPRRHRSRRCVWRLSTLRPGDPLRGRPPARRRAAQPGVVVAPGGEPHRNGRRGPADSPRAARARLHEHVPLRDVHRLSASVHTRSCQGHGAQ